MRNLGIIARRAALAFATALAVVSSDAGAAADEKVPIESLCVTEDGKRHEGQLAFLADESPIRVLFTPRRQGKSIVLALNEIAAVDGKPGSYALYLTKTRANAKLVHWPTLKNVCERTGRKYNANESDLTLTVEGGGTVVLGGMDKLRDLESKRGLTFLAADIDECGAHVSAVFEYAWGDILEPMTFDHGGIISFAGTPGPTLAGLWYRLTTPDIHPPGVDGNPQISLHRWHGGINPFVPDWEAKLAALLKRRGWTEDNPTFVREYLGRWCRDDGVLVFPFSVEKNSVPGLPTKTKTGLEIDPRRWRFAIAVDPGYVDECGFAILAAHPQLAREYVVRTERQDKLIADQVAKHIRRLVAWLSSTYGTPIGDGKYGPVPYQLVMDTGGLGKEYAEVCKRKYALPVEAADKRDKAANVRIVRDELISGRLNVLEGEQNDAIREEWAVLGWDKRKEVPEDGQTDHASDAVCYGHRKLRSERQTEADPPPPVGTKEHWDAEERRIIERMLREGKNAGRPSWDK